jgi:hypothetical protein
MKKYTHVLVNFIKKKQDRVISKLSK